MRCEPYSRALRAYFIRLTVSMLIYFVVLWAVITLFQRPDPPSGLGGALLAMLPAFPIMGAFWAIGRLVVETNDEYQRMLLVKQILIGTALTLSIATVWGFLENFDQVPHLPAFHVAVLWFAMFGVGGAIARLRA